MKHTTISARLDEQLSGRIADFEARMQHRDGARLRRSPEVIQEVLQHSIFPLLETARGNLAMLDRFFLESQSELHTYNTHIRNQHRYFKDLKEVMLEKGKPISPEVQHEILERSFQELGLGYSWQVFKYSGLDVYDEHTKLEVAFGDLKYSVNSHEPHRTELSKLYHQRISEEEKYMLAGELVAEVLERLESRATPPPKMTLIVEPGIEPKPEQRLQ